MQSNGDNVFNQLGRQGMQLGPEFMKEQHGRHPLPPHVMLKNKILSQRHDSQCLFCGLTPKQARHSGGCPKCSPMSVFVVGAHRPSPLDYAKDFSPIVLENLRRLYDPYNDLSTTYDEYAFLTMKTLRLARDKARAERMLNW